MARRNAFFEVEQVKQLALIDRLPTHHGKPPPPVASTRRNHCSPFIASPFSTVSTHLGHRPASPVAVAKLFLTSIKVVVRADTMPSPEPRVRHEAAGISRRSWGRDGCVAACRARATVSALSTRWRAYYRCRK